MSWGAVAESQVPAPLQIPLPRQLRRMPVPPDGLRAFYGLVCSVVDAGDELAAAQHLERRAAEADVEACVLGEEHLVPGLDPGCGVTDRGDDPAAAAGVLARGDDQPVAGLRLLVRGLDHDVVVERLECEGGVPGFLDHGGETILPIVPSPFIELDVGDRLVKVTNPDKVFFSARGETKGDLVRYYLAVGDGIVRALYERPTQLKRHPDGAEGEAIYQKRVPERRPDWIETARVTFPSGRHADELCVTELAHVIWAVNLGTLDFHPWPSRRADVEHPDELRIDIDPQPGTTFADAKRVGVVVREVLDELGFVGWPKTSGNRGIHVACRIEPRRPFPEVRRCALAFAREVERRLPELVTTAWWKEERGEKVFIDYNQNARDRTIASGYSVRARADGTVSAPVTWDELQDVETEDFTIATMPARFAELGDLHAGIDGAVCDLEKLVEWVERDEGEGVGEAPYPPNFPKMPGEPKRVQPSRAKREPKE
jgi:DNA ligase D-like protein (predicted polymerase)